MTGLGGPVQLGPGTVGIVVVHRLPFHTRFVGVIDLDALPDCVGQQMQLRMNTVPLGVGMGS